MTKNVEVLKKARVYDGFFKVDLLEMKRTTEHGETTLVREVFERGHSASVLLFDPDMDCVLLVEELRAGPVAAGLGIDECFCLGPVAGGIEMKDGVSPEEAAIQAALREVEEESGMIITREELAGPVSTMVSPGGTSEIIHHFVAMVDLSKVVEGSVHGVASEDEEIVSKVVSRADARAMIGSGIQNGLTVTSMMMLDMLIMENELKASNTVVIKPLLWKKKDIAPEGKGSREHWGGWTLTAKAPFKDVTIDFHENHEKMGMKVAYYSSIAGHFDNEKDAIQETEKAYLKAMSDALEIEVADEISPAAADMEDPS
jgi:ADP-ribose pyrophosphatase